jgi:hypothetical protein
MNPDLRVTSISFGTDNAGAAITTVTVFLRTSLLKTQIEIERPQSDDLSITLQEVEREIRTFRDELSEAVDAGLLFEGGPGP